MPLRLIGYRPESTPAKRSVAGSSCFASQLRRELSARNRAFAVQRGLPHVESYGGLPVVVYRPSDDGACHGNFADPGYAAILKHAAWRKRLEKVHTQARTSLPKCDRPWRELDSCNSSDALLMNIFCYPGVAEDPRVVSLLGIEAGQLPEFGVKARVPLANGLADRTEVDMRLGDLLVEAKLTEADFQSKSIDTVYGYRDFKTVFHAKLLPKGGGRFLSYQLIRNVLAAQASGSSFCVLLDARRPDLRESWFAVMRAVRPVELRLRCKVLTWQELSEALPPALREFLDLKYGIAAPGCDASPIPGIDPAD